MLSGRLGALLENIYYMIGCKRLRIHRKKTRKQT